MATSGIGDSRAATAAATRGRLRRPFAWLEPGPGLERTLTAEAQSGLARLGWACEPMVPQLVRGLVNLTGEHRRRPKDAAAPVTALNRRRRAATAWLRAILAGSVDRQTLHEVGHAWIPNLVGGGFDKARNLAVGGTCVEYLRGALTALVFRRPEDNLVPEARSLLAIDEILAAHLAGLTAACQD